MRTSILIMKKCTGTGSKSDKKQIKPTPLQKPHSGAIRTSPLRWEELVVCAGGAAAIIVITEVKKLYLRKKQDYITG